VQQQQHTIHSQVCNNNNTPSTHRCATTTAHHPLTGVQQQQHTIHSQVCNNNNTPSTHRCATTTTHHPLTGVQQQQHTIHSQVCNNNSYLASIALKLHHPTQIFVSDDEVEA